MSQIPYLTLEGRRNGVLVPVNNAAGPDPYCRLDSVERTWPNPIQICLGKCLFSLTHTPFHCQDDINVFDTSQPAGGSP
jgi:hypothetical protein